ncbi:hypothetical protein CFH99_07830 [Nocardioides aromaticivorans]|uniref:Terminase small subunit n=1 Tax=Nocardioides aromaticivorans TaxID=200618 RepID=A0ABX7PID4_9ACTN|nr:hypothetical protein [Nocardioides aromaticivorans]QSR25530.1 hypothetical protein CFH99_07830 [Nocardioides aromaticivorans]
MSKPKAPDSLNDAGKALWDEVVKKYDLRADELRTLEDACGATDMLDTLTREWVALGRPFITKGSMGQEVEHPLIGSIDKQRKARQAFLRQLKLPDDAPAGTVTTNPARAAAESRWKHGS